MSIIKNISELIETLECDSLNFLETIEHGYEREIENVKVEKHCPSLDEKMKMAV